MADRKPTSPIADARTALEQFQDYLAPQLDVYEQAVYLYMLRHSRLVGRPHVIVEPKSVRHKIACGLGKGRSPLAEKTCRDKLKSLKSKGLIELLGRRTGGTAVRVLLPSEIPGLTDPARTTSKAPAKARSKAHPPTGSGGSAQLECQDFFNVPRNCRRIYLREGGRCFYCRRKINDTNFVADHVRSHPAGDDGYRNVVASCRRCNNRKGESAAEDLLRVLFREGCVTADELADRLTALKHLGEGRLKP